MGTTVSMISLKSNCQYKVQEPPQMDFLVTKPYQSVVYGLR